jgi:hypothetical protein
MENLNWENDCQPVGSTIFRQTKITICWLKHNIPSANSLPWKPPLSLPGRATATGLPSSHEARDEAIRFGVVMVKSWLYTQSLGQWSSIYFHFEIDP